MDDALTRMHYESSENLPGRNLRLRLLVGSFSGSWRERPRGRPTTTSPDALRVAFCLNRTILCECWREHCVKWKRSTITTIGESAQRFPP